MQANSSPISPPRDLQLLPAGRLPKVALLFLTRGPMPLEPIWKRFLKPFNTSWSTWEDFFSIHVHPAPGFSYPATSLFAGHAVADPVQAHWGNHSIVEAERVLLRAALKDPQNTHFVLLSEATVPIYPAPAVYAQLVTDNKSRINACMDPTDPKDAEKRMVYRLQGPMRKVGINETTWRKSSQWFALQRRHAEIIAEEEIVNAVFEKECYAVANSRFCVSDEHYIPTVLALKGSDEECACDGEATHVKWPGNFFHPKTYEASDATEDILRTELRGEAACPEGIELAEQAMYALEAAAAEAEEKPIGPEDISEAMHGARVPRMKASCPLFARKIAPDAEEEWRRLLDTVFR